MILELSFAIVCESLYPSFDSKINMVQDIVGNVGNSGENRIWRYGNQIFLRLYPYGVMPLNKSNMFEGI